MINKKVRAAERNNVSNPLPWAGFIAPICGAIIFGLLRYALGLPMWVALPVMLIAFYGVSVLTRVHVNGDS